MHDPAQLVEDLARAARGAFLFFIFSAQAQALEESVQRFQPLFDLAFQALAAAFQQVVNAEQQVLRLGLERIFRQAQQRLLQAGNALERPLRGQVVYQQAQGVRREQAAAQVERRLDAFEPGQQFPGAFFIFQSFGHAAQHLGAHHLGHVFAQILFGEDEIALAVNALALAVEHVVVLEQVLADIEVGALDARLRAFHQPADHADFHRHGVVNLHALHQALGLLAAKAAHQLIFQREVEARGAGVALAGGAAAQLVINAPGLVAL